MKAGLFGLTNSNRDFGKADAWGKNQFNSSFPAALSCYLRSKNLDTNYISMSNNLFVIKNISLDDVFAINPLSKNAYFAFEAQYTPFQKYVVNTLPRTDLVILDNLTGQCLRGLEVKLTALPDNTTCSFRDEKFGSEIVVRPDTIVYLAASIASTSLSIIEQHIKNSGIIITDWSDADEVIINVKKIIDCITLISITIEKQQLPFLLQPVWKTVGKSPKLADNCLDVFVWSDAAFAWFIAQVSKAECTGNKITRQTRTCIWLYKMLSDIVSDG